MINLHFEGASVTYAAALGPAPSFRIAGNCIRQRPEDTIMATYRKHQWEVRGQYFTRWESKDPVAIHFEDMAGGRTEDFGPFRKFFAADGVLYADEKLFGKFVEETQLWHCYPTESFWPILIIKATPSRSSPPPSKDEAKEPLNKSDLPAVQGCEATNASHGHTGCMPRPFWRSRIAQPENTAILGDRKPLKMKESAMFIYSARFSLSVA